MSEDKKKPPKKTVNLKNEIIKNINIKNFRQFDQLEINDLKQVNFFVGENNCGKTTVLEAIILLSEYNNNEFLENGAFRRFPRLSYDTLYYFHNLNINTPIQLNLQTNIYDYTFQMNEFTGDIEDIYEFAHPRMIREIETEKTEAMIEYQFNKKKLTATRGKKNNELFFIRKPASAEKLRNIEAPFLVCDKDNSIILRQVDRIINNVKRDKLISYLQFFDSKIQDIVVSQYEGVRLQIEGMSKQMPLSIMGDGIKKYIKTISPLVLHEYPYLLIDEIENGLHYTTIKHLLSSILELSLSENVQMFITTHNNEIIKYIAEILKENKKYEEITQFLNISNTEKGFKTYPFVGKTVEHLSENDIEIR